MGTEVLKKVVRDEITMYGQIAGENSCHNCVDLNNQLTTENIPKAEIPVDYKHVDVYDNKGNPTPVTDEKKISDIPHVEVCKIAEDNQKQCKTIKGYDPNDWKNIGKSREEKFKVEKPVEENK